MTRRFRCAKGNLKLGQNVGGYIEDLIIKSKTTAPTGISVVSTRVEDNKGYLPAIQPAFNDTADCVVISPDDQMFQDVLDKYALRNISMGIRTVVVPLQSIKPNYSGSDVQEQIRNFLKRAYLQWHLKTAILGAGTDFIPARKVAFPTQNGYSVTTDRYYACLEGTWNDNGNAYFAEPQDSFDLTGEITVARFPAETWSELNSMIEKSSMGFGLPPYNNQCVTNIDDVDLTGMEMFNRIGTVSDGHYYANVLNGIMANGAYTDSMPIRTYYPQDDTTNRTLLDPTARLNKFLKFLTPMPGLWVHFGHGSENELALDTILNKAWMTLSGDEVSNDTIFSHFRQMTHVRVVGCGTASQDQNSVGRMLLANPHGGALTYIGAAEYSYPVTEAQLLQNEFREIADSSIFTWGEVFSRAAEEEMGASSNWDIARWVVLSRNFLGDPLLPVRSKHSSSTTCLKISLSKSIANRGRDSIVVTVLDTSGNHSVPVEGAMVGLVSQKTANEIPTSDSLGWQTQYQPIRNLAFAKGVTNRNGQATLVFTTSYEDFLTISATHNDYYASRINIGVTNSSSLYATFDAQMYCNSLAPAKKNQQPVVGPGAYVFLNVTMKNVSSAPLSSVWGSFSLINDPAKTGISAHVIPMQGQPVNIDTQATAGFFGQFTVDSCPAGENILPVQFKYTSAQQHSDSTVFNVPVVGPKIIPVITYLKDSDNNFTPENGDYVKMQILLGNKYPVAAKNVQCSLFVKDIGHVQLSKTTTAAIPLVYPDSSRMDTSIAYNIVGGYDENANGIIPATLYIKGDNIPHDSINIDLNPIRNATLKIDTSSIVVDYNGGVTFSWNDLKVDSSFGRRSKFLGYVVTRKLKDAPDSLGTTLLTPWAVTAGDYFNDILPNDTTVKNPVYTYSVAMVDSSYNCSAMDELNVPGPWIYALRKGFPIYVGGFDSKPPIVADYNKDGVAEIYTVTQAGVLGLHKGRAIGFRPDGQEAIVAGRNDGLVYDRFASDIAWADLDGDGQDEAIFTAGDSLIVRNFAADTSDHVKNWGRSLNDGDHPFGLQWFSRPVISNIILGDGRLGVILYGMDNGSSTGGHSSVYVYNGTGNRLAKKDFPDGGPYQHGISVGNFYGSSSQGILISHAALSTLYLLRNIDTIQGVFSTVDSILVGATDTTRHVWMVPNSPISVGLAVSSDGVHPIEDVVVNVSDINNKQNPLDTLKLYAINSGSFACLATATIPFKMWSQWTGAPALADLDTDGREEIVFAADDTVYIFKYVQGDTTLHSLAKIPFGSFPSNRLDIYATMPQPLVTKMDSGSGYQIIVNHYGDGLVWAFNVKYNSSTGMCDWTRRQGFPLRAHGRISNACAVTDLEGDDTLDLVAMDDGGYLYAWKLGKGSIYRQPWPYDFGNVWGTGNTQYKPSGNVGYIFSDWTTNGVSPYYWGEYDVNNSTNTTGGGVFQMNPDSFWVQAGSGQDNNLFYTGPNLTGLKNYIMQGKIRFDNASAEFGINFYGQWPGTAKKYSIIRKADGLAHLYYTDTTSFMELQAGVFDSTSRNDSLKVLNQWYDYRIVTSPLGSMTRIQAWFWKDGMQMPQNPAIDKSDSRLTAGGLVGLVAHAGTGNREWGPMKVVSDSSGKGAYLAYEDFKEDTVVDVKPYTPANFHPLYGTTQFTVGPDSTGFVLDTTGYHSTHSVSMVYRHRPGTQYPVTCLVAPQTNLEWRDYTFADTIIKPSGSVYDSVDLYVPFYYTDSAHTYELEFKQNGVVLNGGWFRDSVLSTTKINGGDTLAFAITVTTNPLGDIPDGDVLIILSCNRNGLSILDNKRYPDDSAKRIKGGLACLKVDYGNISNLDSRSLLPLSPIKFKRVIVEKFAN